jgi:hypothetical protein
MGNEIVELFAEDLGKRGRLKVIGTAARLQGARDKRFGSSVGH